MTNNMRQFAITAPGFEIPDFVYGENEDDAILEWARMIVEVEVTEIEQN
jgi:hypothetical protein